MLRICNSVLSVLTLLLIATAASKMALYIQAYGLTVKRVFASVFLVWMAISFVLILIRQVRRFRLVSWMVFTGAVLYCALCVLPVEAGIDAYNQARVEAGTLRPAAQTLLDLPDGSAAEMALTGEDAMAMTDEGWKIQTALQILRQNSARAAAESLSDEPQQAQELLTLEFYRGADAYRVYAYRRSGACWLEQPYNGIYALPEEDFQTLWSLLEE